jgi:uncharacterized protein YjbJ (UPF0337 family)
MLNNKLRGSWDQMSGISRELWGELTGNGEKYKAGHRQREIGKLEVRCDMSHDKAEQQVDQQKQ